MNKHAGSVVLRAVRATAVSGPTDRELLASFVAGDQDAFAALVARHAAMVLGVCRRSLANVQDAEDACQATFLVLANRARTGNWQDSVANWLFTTARKVAANARKAGTRRLQREAQATPPASTALLDQMTGREAFAILDEELHKLPALYREPLVLCYLEGLTRDEAASRLNVPVATLKSQLERGRKKLGDALTRRGVVLGAGLLAVAVTSQAKASSPRLIESILTAASGQAPAAIGELARGVAVNGSIHKVVFALAVTVVVALGAGLGSLELSSASQPPGKPASAAAEKAQAKDVTPKPATKESTLNGRVLGHDSKPLAGAKLFLSRIEGLVEVGASDADGKFSVKVPANGTTVTLIARAEGVGLDFAYIFPDRFSEEVELHLVKDQAISGRVVDTQGKPVPGASVAVSKVEIYVSSLDNFLTEHKRAVFVNPGKSLWREAGVLPAVTTDKDGKFTINGAGRERLVTLHISGTGLADTEVCVVNRKDFDPKPYNEPKPELRPGMRGYAPGRRMDSPRVLYGPDVSVITEPEKRVRGTLTDVDTGKPRAGVKVMLVRNVSEGMLLNLSAVTDGEGRYEIRGARKSTTYTVAVDGDSESRHVAARVRVDDTAGYEPLTADIKVKKGVVVTGKVIDTGTKKSVRGYATVAIMSDNKFAKDYPEMGMTGGTFSSTREDATFRVVTIPGPVLLMGGASGERDSLARYKRPVPDPNYPQYFVKPNGAVPGGVSVPAYIGYGGNNFGLVQGSFCKVLDIKADAETVTQDILLDPVE
jgi:RNA polymerase sigma factor (sigma-70 family)